MKAILVIDMPECCYDCDFCRFNGGYMNGYYGRDCLITGESVQNNFNITTSRHKTCPLKPMPERKEVITIVTHNRENAKLEIANQNKGFNDCIDEILGAENEI